MRIITELDMDLGEIGMRTVQAGADITRNFDGQIVISSLRVELGVPMGDGSLDQSVNITTWLRRAAIDAVLARLRAVYLTKGLHREIGA